MKKNRIFNIFKWLWIILVLAGAIFYFYKNWDHVSKLLAEIQLWRIFLSLVLLIVGKAFIVLFVKYSVNAEGWHPKYIHLLGLYGMAGLGKYIPGGIWHFVGRLGAYRMSGMDIKSATRSIVLENFWLISSAVVVGFSGLSISRFDLISEISGVPNNTLMSVLFVFLLILIWLLALVVLHRIVGKKTKAAIQNPLIIMLIGIIIWLFIGSSFYTMFSTFPVELLPLFIGGYALSWAVGYVAIFAPGGIGVREAVISWLFGAIISIDMIAVYSAMNRIVFTIAELLYGLVGVFQKQSFLFSDEKIFQSKNSHHDLIDNQNQIDPKTAPQTNDDVELEEQID